MNRPKKGRPDGPPLIFANDGWVNFSAFVTPSRQHQVEVTEVRLAVTVHVATVRSEPTGQNDAEIAEAHLSVAARSAGHGASSVKTPKVRVPDH